MQIHVARLMQQRTGATGEVDICSELAEFDSETRVREPLVGRIRLLRILNGILVSGRLTTRVELSCDRCLTNFTRRIEVALEDEFRPSIDISTGASLPAAPEDSDSLIDASHVLDLSEVVRQRLILNLPPHPLCRDDCKGLCSSCGRDLNEGVCECGEGVPDPRWNALRELLA